MKLVVRKSGCPNCDRLKTWLAAQVYEIPTVVAEENMDLCRKHKVQTVPALLVDRLDADDKEFVDVIFGFDDIVKYLEA